MYQAVGSTDLCYTQVRLTKNPLCRPVGYTVYISLAMLGNSGTHQLSMMATVS